MYKLGKVPELRDKFRLLNNVKYHIMKTENLLGPNDIVEPPHIHTELEIILNVSAEISFLVNGNLYPLNSGDIIISKPNDVHVCVYNKRKKQGMYILWLNERDNTEFFNLFYKDGFSNKVSFDRQTKDEVLSLFSELNDLYCKENKDMEKAYLILRLLNLIKKGDKANDIKKVVPDNLQKTLDYINKNFATIYSIKEILEKNYLSYSTLNRLFNTYLNVSPKVYLDSVKMSNASKLLQNGSSVLDACFKSGFTDCSRFITIFKNRFGTTPFNYKKNKRA